MSAPEPGWYHDGTGEIRWWNGSEWADAAPASEDPAEIRRADGESWSDNVAHAPGDTQADQVYMEQGAALPQSRPRRRRGWIIGGAVAGALAVVAGVVLATTLRAGDPSGGSASDASADAAADDATADHAADDPAWQSILVWADSFESADCDTFFQVTTTAYRERNGMPDCDSFVVSADGRSRVINDFQMTLEDSRRSGTDAQVVTVHTEYESLLSKDGQPADEPVKMAADYAFHLTRSDGGWQIDDAHDVSDGRAEWEASDDEREDAENAIADWAEALVAAECDAMVDASTSDFRADMGWTDCAAFQEFAATYPAGCALVYEPGKVQFRTRLDADFEEIHVEVVESCTWDVADDGSVLDPPYEERMPWKFELVQTEGSWKVDEMSEEPQLPASPGDESEVQAVEAVAAYNTAWTQTDCSLLDRVTTPSLRYNVDADTCAKFEEASRSYASSLANLVVVATRIEHSSPTTIRIMTRESYDSIVDEAGNPAEPVPYTEYWLYTLVLDGGEWVINDVSTL